MSVFGFLHVCLPVFFVCVKTEGFFLGYHESKVSAWKLLIYRKSCFHYETTKSLNLFNFFWCSRKNLIFLSQWFWGVVLFFNNVGNLNEMTRRITSSVVIRIWLCHPVVRKLMYVSSIQFSVLKGITSALFKISEDLRIWICLRNIFFFWAHAGS